jgi:hypothetical protein
MRPIATYIGGLSRAADNSRVVMRILRMHHVIGASARLLI